MTNQTGINSEFDSMAETAETAEPKLPLPLPPKPIHTMPMPEDFYSALNPAYHNHQPSNVFTPQDQEDPAYESAPLTEPIEAESFDSFHPDWRLSTKNRLAAFTSLSSAAFTESLLNNFVKQTFPLHARLAKGTDTTISYIRTSDAMTLMTGIADDAQYDFLEGVKSFLLEQVYQHKHAPMTSIQITSWGRANQWKIPPTSTLSQVHRTALRKAAATAPYYLTRLQNIWNLLFVKHGIKLELRPPQTFTMNNLSKLMPALRRGHIMEYDFPLSEANRKQLKQMRAGKAKMAIFNTQLGMQGTIQAHQSDDIRFWANSAFTARVIHRNSNTMLGFAPSAMHPFTLMDPASQGILEINTHTHLTPDKFPNISPFIHDSLWYVRYKDFLSPIGSRKAHVSSPFESPSLRAITEQLTYATLVAWHLMSQHVHLGRGHKRISWAMSPCTKTACIFWQAYLRQTTENFSKQLQQGDLFTGNVYEDTNESK